MIQKIQRQFRLVPIDPNKCRKIKDYLRYVALQRILSSLNPLKLSVLDENHLKIVGLGPNNHKKLEIFYP